MTRSVRFGRLLGRCCRRERLGMRLGGVAVMATPFAAGITTRDGRAYLLSLFCALVVVIGGAFCLVCGAALVQESLDFGDDAAAEGDQP